MLSVRPPSAYYREEQCNFQSIVLRPDRQHAFADKGSNHAN
ncbi:MAG: hypothetical protein ACK6D0_09585 [Planctomyces sp.]